MLKGKCTDINSVFVALARASGIPAREIFGIRLGAADKMGKYSKGAFGSADEHGVANVSGGQHCRAEFYLTGFGWVPVDSADVAKMRLAEKKSVEDKDTQAVANICLVTGKQTGSDLIMPVTSIYIHNQNRLQSITSAIRMLK